MIWRRRWDLNPCAGHPTYSLSRGAPSPLGYFSGSMAFWRRVWDLNPGNLSVCRFSRAVPSTTRPTLHIKLLFVVFQNLVETDAKLTPLLAMSAREVPVSLIYRDL